nr:hypothetical protein [Tanacetum cinerariifolium]
MVGDDSSKKGDSSSSFDLNLVFDYPLYLHLNDTNGLPIMTVKLTGTENYKVLSIAMTFALRNHNKTGLIDDLCYDDNYLAIRSNILTREPLPLVKAAFAIVSGEESYRNITSSGATKHTDFVFTAKTFDKKKSNNNNNSRGSNSSSNTNKRGPNPNLKCTNCNKIRHIVDRCFKILAYLAGYVKGNFNSIYRRVTNNNTTVDPHSNNASSNTASNSPIFLSNEQLTCDTPKFIHRSGIQHWGATS